MARKPVSKDVQIGLDEVVCHFQELEDPREPINVRHPLVSVVVIAIMAGASGPTSIAEWAAAKSEFLVSVLAFQYGVPRKDVFRRIFSALKPDAFQSCFNNWILSLQAQANEATGESRPILAIDGKTLRRSHNHAKGLGPLHSVTVWTSEVGVTLAQVATDEKSNEITAIPEVLKLVNLDGAIVTIDAMWTQTQIARQIVEGGADYVLALKGNQGTLHQSVVDYIDLNVANNFEDIPTRQLETEEASHGTEENRLYVQIPAPKTPPGFDRWAGLLTIGVVMHSSVRNGKDAYDICYYISSLRMKVEQFAHAVRSHQSIENSCHQTLDVTYREDESRTRDEYLRENLAWLNRFTLSLLKQQKNKNSVAMNRRRFGWNDDVLLETLTTLTTQLPLALGYRTIHA